MNCYSKNIPDSESQNRELKIVRNTVICLVTRETKFNTNKPKLLCE